VYVNNLQAYPPLSESLSITDCAIQNREVRKGDEKTYQSSPWAQARKRLEERERDHAPCDTDDDAIDNKCYDAAPERADGAVRRKRAD
jgi:hypothetical protein